MQMQDHIRTWLILSIHVAVMNNGKTVQPLWSLSVQNWYISVLATFIQDHITFDFLT